MLRGVSSPLSGDRPPAWSPYRQRTSLLPDVAVRCATTGGSPGARCAVNSPSHETECLESREDRVRSPRFLDGRVRHRFHGAAVPGTRLPACELGRWPSGSTLVFPLCEIAVPAFRQRRAYWCKPQTPGTCAHVRVGLLLLRSAPALSHTFRSCPDQPFRQ